MGRIEAATGRQGVARPRPDRGAQAAPPVEHGKDYNELLRATLAERPAPPARGPPKKGAYDND